METTPDIAQPSLVTRAAVTSKTVTRVWAHDDSGRRLFAEIRTP